MDFDDFEDEAGGGGDFDPTFSSLNPDGTNSFSNPDELFGAEEKDEINEWKTKKDAVIFLIDCREELFKKDILGTEETQFDQIMSGYRSFLKYKIISNSDDKIGLIFFNVKKEENTSSFPGVNMVHDLNIVSAERIKQASKLAANFNRDYGLSQKENPLYEAFWTCNHEFKNIDSKTHIKRIFLFTCEDHPHANSKSERDSAIQHAKILYEAEVAIELFPLKKSQSHAFDIKAFFADMIVFDEDELNAGDVDMSSKITQLNKRLRAKEFKKRTLGRVLWDIGESMKIAVGFYCNVNKTKTPYGVYLDAKTNKILRSTGNFICKETGQTLYQNQIGLAAKLGGEKVPFKKEEMDHVKKFDEPSLKLIGFKPRGALKDYQNYKNSYFLYPDEDRVSGSSQVFDALTKEMLKKGKIAIVKFVPRTSAQLRFCALIPQLESYDDDHFQTPPGFQVIFLPFADDIRKPDTVLSKNYSQPQNVQVTAAKLLINALSKDELDCRNFENPAIQTFFTRLQEIALTEKNQEEFEDLLLPDEEGMKKCAGDLIDLFKQSLNIDGNEAPSSGGARGQRRGRAGGPGARGGAGTSAGRGGRGGKNAKAGNDDEEGSKSPERGVPLKRKPPTDWQNDGEDEAPKRGGRGRGRGRGRENAGGEEAQPKRGGRGRGRGGAKKKGVKSDSESEENDYDYSDSFIEDDREEKNKKPSTRTKKNAAKEFRDTLQIKEEDENENEVMMTIYADVEESLKAGEFEHLDEEALKGYLTLKGLSRLGSKERMIDRALGFLSSQN